MSEPTRWRRLALESATVVGSILLAFAIDAAWDLRQERAEERELLLGLRAELVANAMEVERSRAETLQALDLLYDFLATPPEEWTEETTGDGRGQVYLALVRNWSGAFTAGFVDAATSSGRLALIRDPDVAASVARFRRALDDMDDMVNRLGLVSVRASEVIGRYRAADRTLTGNAWRIEPGTVRALARDPEVIGLASAKAVHFNGYLFVLDSLDDRIEEALQLLAVELAD